MTCPETRGIPTPNPQLHLNVLLYGRSINRVLDDKLYLVVKKKGADGFDFPQGPVPSDQTLRQVDSSVNNA